jgi:putative oxidoreductase
MNSRLINIALLFLRLAGCSLLLSVHGLPKLMNFSHELTVIEDPFNMGAPITLSLAIFAEIVCPILIGIGLFTRIATLPILVVLLVSLVLVHPQWSLTEGQFAWLLLILFTTIAIAGPGRYAVKTPMGARYAVCE